MSPGGGGCLASGPKPNWGGGGSDSTSREREVSWSPRVTAGEAMSFDMASTQLYVGGGGGQAGAMALLREQVRLAPAWYSALSLRPE